MIKPEEWSREFSPLEAELDKLSRISAEEWAGQFTELEAELDRMRTGREGESQSLQAEAAGTAGQPHANFREIKGEGPKFVQNGSGSFSK